MKMNIFQFKKIPFYSTASTGRSYNVGVNYQQKVGALKHKRTPHKYDNQKNSMNENEDADSIQLETLLSRLSAKTRKFKNDSASVWNLDFGKYKELNSLYRHSNELTNEDEDFEDSKTVVLSGPSGDATLNNIDTTLSSGEQPDDVKPDNIEIQRIKSANHDETMAKICLPKSPNNSYMSNEINQISPSRSKKLASNLNAKTYQQIHGNRNVQNLTKLHLTRSRTLDSLDKNNKDFLNDTDYEEAKNLSAQTVNNVNTLCNFLSKSGNLKDNTVDVDKNRKTINTVVTIRQKIITDTKEDLQDITKYTVKEDLSQSLKKCKKFDGTFQEAEDMLKTSMLPVAATINSTLQNTPKSAKSPMLHKQDSNVQNICPNSQQSFNRFSFEERQKLHRVLRQLHDDFEHLNKKYDYLSMLAKKGGYKEVNGELEILDVELNKKEEEILAIITLCKEIMIVKDQQLLQKKIRDNSTSMSKNDIYYMIYGAKRHSDIAIIPFS